MGVSVVSQTKSRKIPTRNTFPLFFVIRRGAEAAEPESLVNSGAIHGRTLGFVADARLATDVQPADPAALLRAVNALEVVTHVPAPSYCARHEPFDFTPWGPFDFVWLPARTPHGVYVW